MNVGIITFNRAINYGAVLQSYALKNTIINLGHDCEVINYKCKEVERGASPFYVRSFSAKDILIFLLQIKMRIIKNQKFKNFTDTYLDTILPVLTEKSIKDGTIKYDLLITGSDQVWNYEITGLDENYFLTFAGNSVRTASYAASFGVADIPKQWKEKYIKLLSHIQYISVREETGKNIINSLVAKEASILIDPVFLLHANDWREICYSPDVSSKYILVYSINKAGCYKMAEKISEEIRLPIIALQTPMGNRTKCRKIRDESPQEFLGWFKDAEYVITDSFHGTAFSIIFNKKFLLCDGGSGTNRLSRQLTLLKAMGIENRFCRTNEYKRLYSDINYARVNKNIENAQFNALKYLKEILN